MSNFFNNASYELMEYLSKKLFSKSKEIETLIKNISIQLPADSSILVSLNDVDTELKQASYAIKALITENKALNMKIQASVFQTPKVNYKPSSSMTSAKKSKQVQPTCTKKCRSISPEKITKKNPVDYSSELVMKIIQYPNTIVALTSEFGKNFMVKMMKNDVSYDYLEKINDIINQNIDKGIIVSCGRSSIPLRIKMACKNKNIYSYKKNQYRKSNIY